MKARVLVLCLSALLSACGGPQLLKGSGVEAPPLAGYTKLCAEHPELASCPTP